MAKQSFFDNLAELSPGQPRYIGERELELDIETIIGFGELSLGDQILRVKIKNFYVQLLPASTEIVNGTRYQVKLQKFTFEEKQTTVSNSRRKTKGLVDAGLGAKLEWWGPSFFGRLRAEGTAAGETTNASSSVQSRRPEVVLITPGPQNTWRVGDDKGDVRKAGGFLYGSYFQEARSEGLNNLSPLCVVRTEGRVFKFSVGLFVKTEDFHFELLDKWGANAGTPNLSQRDEFERRMKARISGISLQKAIRQATKQFSEVLQNNEVLICLGVIDQTDVISASD